MTSKILTQKKLKELLRYNANTGIFTWRRRVGRISAGTIAGTTNDQGYILICIDYQSYRAHRLAWLYMTGDSPLFELDHENHKRADNKWSNIRASSPLDNARNHTQQRNNTSGVTGVRWHARDRRWMALININGKQIHGGSFVDFRSAVAARKGLELKYNFHPNHGKT